jgi:hypothetical protein
MNDTQYIRVLLRVLGRVLVQGQNIILCKHE